ncbi:MAG: hypothetical protein IT406_00045 [Candidatus Yanofskybacteria bacterium]|nr:hypothetical protein [Candidatus Yanofskybacteria bacterium]
MGVFSIHPEQPSRRGVFAVLAVAAVLAGGVLATSQFPNVIPTAAELNALQGLRTDPEPADTVFPEPRAIDIEARIIGTLVSGEGLALQRLDTREYVQAYFPEGGAVKITEGPVRITGQWVGISCAYAATFFEGRCTPDIRIETIGQLDIAPE